MDGLDSGSWHFDSMRLRQCSCLRGCWLIDGAGEPCCFAVGAYGWSPLLEAIRAMGLLYLLSFLFFQLVGAALWLSMRRSMVHPLGKLERALGAEPLQVSSAEYDYLLPYGELRGPVAAYLLRRQMQYAAAVTPGTARPPEECPLLLTELQRCEDKLLPILTDRGQRITRELKADGRVSADVHFNPNGSLFAVEGITSPDGRVFGKMGHAERIGSNLYQNVPGNYDLRMFEAAVKYFR